MAVESETGPFRGEATRPWNDPRVRAIFYQAVVLALIALGAWYLIANTIDNLQRAHIASGFGFLNRESGFAIGESPIAYSPASTYGRAFLVGLLNTFRVAILGIVFCTIIGVVMGIARLSSNLLVAKAAAGYVNVIRNIPLLLQLFIWYGVISVSLPAPRQALQPVSGFFLSNRGLQVPVPEPIPAYGAMAVALLVGIVATVVIARWAKARQMRTGQPFVTGKVGAGLIIGLPLLAWLVFGAPLAFSVPELHGFNFRGGVTMTPEFTAVLFGLTFYTAGFIAEIVRSGILAVSFGQTEAALALGLTRGQVLRLVVLPQAMRIIIPPTTSQYLNLVKNSSLAVAVGYPDLVSVGNTTMNQTGQAVEAVTIFMAVYLLISLAISAFMNWYNRHVALVER
ncbi:MAG TPA: amino acid ABC transporter permease [Alphaproteobacteria bacterium]|nr:amino acid ABC transporter permease [Alphaproteobacteria bacterium]